MNQLIAFLPVLVILSPYILIIGVVYLHNRRLAKKLALVFGIVFSLILLVALVTAFSGNPDRP